MPLPFKTNSPGLSVTGPTVYLWIRPQEFHIGASNGKEGQHFQPPKLALLFKPYCMFKSSRGDYYFKFQIIEGLHYLLELS